MQMKHIIRCCNFWINCYIHIITKVKTDAIHSVQTIGGKQVKCINIIKYKIIITNI